MKQKLIIISILLFGFTKASIAQSDSTRSIGPDGMYVGIYHLANKFNDPAVARMALYHLLLFSSEKTKVLDSLALYYFDYQQWTSAALVSKENLKLNPDNLLALEITALAFEKIGIKDQSLDHYEKLFLKNNDSNVLYKMAFLQFNLSRLKESKASIEILMNRTELDSLVLVFPKVDKTQQEVSMKAALLNLKGLIAKEEGNIQKAKEYYLEALKASPGFEIAQINLKDADK